MSVVETFHGYIETTKDALLLFEACRRGLLPKIGRRLQEKERDIVRSGSVFVFDEQESGIKRWTDGLTWSPSRILGNFLIYRELDRKNADRKLQERPRATDVDETEKNKERALVGSLTNSYKFRKDGLVKKSLSLMINGVPQHLISYYSKDDVLAGKLRTPTSVPELSCLEISQQFLVKQNFRVPPMGEDAMDVDPEFASTANGTGPTYLARRFSTRPGGSTEFSPSVRRTMSDVSLRGPRKLSEIPDTSIIFAADVTAKAIASGAASTRKSTAANRSSTPGRSSSLSASVTSLLSRDSNGQSISSAYSIPSNPAPTPHWTELVRAANENGAGSLSPAMTNASESDSVPSPPISNSFQPSSDIGNIDVRLASVHPLTDQTTDPILLMENRELGVNDGSNVLFDSMRSSIQPKSPPSDPIPNPPIFPHRMSIPFGRSQQLATSKPAKEIPLRFNTIKNDLMYVPATGTGAHAAITVPLHDYSLKRTTSPPLGINDDVSMDLVNDTLVTNHETTNSQRVTTNLPSLFTGHTHVIMPLKNDGDIGVTTELFAGSADEWGIVTEIQHRDTVRLVLDDGSGCVDIELAGRALKRHDVHMIHPGSFLDVFGTVENRRIKCIGLSVYEDPFAEVYHWLRIVKLPPTGSFRPLSQHIPKSPSEALYLSELDIPSSPLVQERKTKLPTDLDINSDDLVAALDVSHHLDESSVHSDKGIDLADMDLDIDVEMLEGLEGLEDLEGESNFSGLPATKSL
ncbi:hypothetical protein BZG36_05128 [Bifiguratus adelaidae]|uniref:Uncharacterized protein n=1 Tax=Bifiguratus adelaidae TaxID=1938954 RepID=A0A261XUF9_9FUNG|nr:hypothetical protein BZG36_05128 [Bifiguratus adelaidae]